MPDVREALREIGAGEGHRIGVVTGNTMLHVLLHAVAHDDGVTLVPFGPKTPPLALEEQGAVAGVVAWVIEEGTPWRPDAPHVVATADGMHASGHGRIRGEPGDLAHIILHTSGTTGGPKPVPVTRSMLDAHREACIGRIEHDSGALWYACLPLWHVGGVALLDRCLRTQSRWLLAPRFDAQATAKALAEQPVTHISLVPTMLRRLLDIGASPPPSLRCALVGGDRLDPSLAASALDAGWPVFASYGLTEATSQVATATPDEVRDLPGTSGKPLPGVHVTTHGAIAIEGPTAAGGRVETSDVGRIEDGRLFVSGRLMERIITGGETLDARQIEAALTSVPGVDAACVVGLADAEWGQRVACAYEGSVTPDAVRAAARGLLPAHAVPKHIEHLAALPRTSAGKLRRGEVLARLQTVAT